jgi:hypothetical protein
MLEDVRIATALATALGPPGPARAVHLWADADRGEGGDHPEITR